MGIFRLGLVLSCGLLLVLENLSNHDHSLSIPMGFDFIVMTSYFKSYAKLAIF
jgi:hypothetical protein